MIPDTSLYKSPQSNLFNFEVERPVYTQLIAQEAWQKIAERLQKQGIQMIHSGHLPFLKDMLDQVTTRGIQHPSLNLLYGYLSSIIGEWDTALHHFTTVCSSSVASE